MTTDSTNEITPENVREILSKDISMLELCAMPAIARAYLKKCEEVDQEKTINKRMLNNIERLLETNQRLLNKINKASMALISY